MTRARRPFARWIESFGFWITMLVIGLVATYARVVLDYGVPGPFDPTQQGLCDFHNGVYYPTRAWIDGISPYGLRYAETYPVSKPIPLFSPAILAMHAPIAMLPLRMAEIVFSLANIAIVALIAWLTARVIFSTIKTDQTAAQPVASVSCLGYRFDYRTLMAVIATTIVYSRGGHSSLFQGYFTLVWVLASLLSVHWAGRRDVPAALALCVAATKPTYLLPLGFLLLAQRRFRALIAGALLSVVTMAASTGYLVYKIGDGDISAGWESLVTEIETAHQLHRDVPDETPMLTWTRVDVVALYGKWAGYDPSDVGYLLIMMSMLLPSMAAIFWCPVDDQADPPLVGLRGGLIAITALVCVYHQFYDALIIVPPLFGLMTVTGGWSNVGRRWRVVIVIALLSVLMNYFTTSSFLSRLEPSVMVHRVITSGTAVILIVAWLVTLGVTIRCGGRSGWRVQRHWKPTLGSSPPE